MAMLRGWNVEIWVWKQNISASHRRMGLEDLYRPRLSIRVLDDYLHLIAIDNELSPKISKDRKRPRSDQTAVQDNSKSREANVSVLKSVLNQKNNSTHKEPNIDVLNEENSEKNQNQNQNQNENNNVQHCDVMDLVSDSDDDNDSDNNDDKNEENGENEATVVVLNKSSDSTTPSKCNKNDSTSSSSNDNNEHKNNSSSSDSTKKQKNSSPINNVNLNKSDNNECNSDDDIISISDDDDEIEIIQPVSDIVFLKSVSGTPLRDPGYKSGMGSESSSGTKTVMKARSTASIEDID